ncbi:MAG: hypothetical protein K9L60_13130 [Methylovulum sp.]|nr:hypothetical protein [Methylovulum sp.]MCF7999951.1 hypothetical protein [Methylovulum sp.]
MFIETKKPEKITEMETNLIIDDLSSRMNKLIDDTLVLIKKEANDDKLKIQEIEISFSIALSYWVNIKKKTTVIGVDHDAEMAEMNSAFYGDEKMRELYLSKTIMHNNLFFQSIKEGNILEALEAVCDAFESYGMAKAYIDSNASEEMKKEAFFKLMADIRHAENRDMKAQVIQYYKDHKSDFQSKDDAAFHISNKIVNVAFSTARGYIKNI